MERGASIDLRDDTKFTPLMIAALNGYSEVADILLNAGESTAKLKGAFTWIVS